MTKQEWIDMVVNDREKAIQYAMTPKERIVRAYEEKVVEVEKLIVSQRVPSFAEYWKLVWDITNSQPLETLTNFERRGWNDYHIDHKISVWYGWKNEIDPLYIGHISNLRMIPKEENMKKGIKSLFS